MNAARPLKASALLAAMCSLLAAPGMAQSDGAPAVETVTVEASTALPGIWRFPPHWRQMSGNGFQVMGPAMDCRIALSGPGYSFDCFEIAERSMQATLTADAKGHLDLSWRVEWGDTGNCRWTFRGDLRSQTEIVGNLGMKCNAGRTESRMPLAIEKVVLPGDTPDTGGQAQFLHHLLDEMASGEVSESYAKARYTSTNPHVHPLPDDAQDRLSNFLTPEMLRPLGKVTAVIFVDDYFPIVGWWYEEGLHNSPVFADKRPIYAVEFENGELLCTLHRRADGILDQFQCV